MIKHQFNITFEGASFKQKLKLLFLILLDKEIPIEWPRDLSRSAYIDLKHYLCRCNAEDEKERKLDLIRNRNSSIDSGTK
jgi:hypothetical protein